MRHRTRSVVAGVELVAHRDRIDEELVRIATDTAELIFDEILRFARVGHRSVVRGASG